MSTMTWADKVETRVRWHRINEHRRMRRSRAEGSTRRSILQGAIDRAACSCGRPFLAGLATETQVSVEVQVSRSGGR